MADPDNLKLLRRLNTTFLVVFLVFIVCQFLFLYKLTKVRRRINVDEQRVLQAVRDSVHDFLADYTGKSEESSQDTITNTAPSVMFADFSTATKYDGTPYFFLEGSRYYVGDYCKYGLVVHIDDGKFFCRGNDGAITIVRFGSSAPVPAEPPAAENVAAGGGEERGGRGLRFF